MGGFRVRSGLRKFFRRGLQEDEGKRGPQPQEAGGEEQGGRALERKKTNLLQKCEDYETDPDP